MTADIWTLIGADMAHEHDEITGNCVERAVLRLQRASDENIFAVSVRQHRGELTDDTLIGALKAALNACLIAAGLPLVEGSRLVDSTDQRDPKAPLHS